MSWPDIPKLPTAICHKTVITLSADTVTLNVIRFQTLAIGLWIIQSHRVTTV